MREGVTVHLEAGADRVPPLLHLRKRRATFEKPAKAIKIVRKRAIKPVATAQREVHAFFFVGHRDHVGIRVPIFGIELKCWGAIHLWTHREPPIT